MNDDFLANTKLPPRSQLYSIHISGTTGRDQEALIDYIHRLAVEHCVKVRHLLSQIILPEAKSAFGLTGVLRDDGHLTTELLRTCNGTGKYANTFVRVLEKLTGQQNLGKGTLIGWQSFFDPKGIGLLSPHRRWCPQCLEEQRRAGSIRHHLAWMIIVTSLCPTHYVPLQSFCSKCGHTQPFIHDSLCSAKCCYCSYNLEHAEGDTTVRVSSDARERYMANSVVEILELSNWAASFASPDITNRRIKAVADLFTGGSVTRLEKLIGFPSGTLRNKGGKSLQLFLEITYRLGLAPSEFLLTDKLPDISKSIGLSMYRTNNRRAVILDASLKLKIYGTLKEALDHEDRLITKREFCELVGITPSYLAYHFDDVLEKLTNHNKRIVPLLKGRRREECWRSARILIDALVMEGQTLTNQKIDTILKATGLYEWRSTSNHTIAIAMYQALATEKINTKERQDAGDRFSE